MKLPNYFPAITAQNGVRLAIIDLMPSVEEVTNNSPYSTQDHQILKSLLNQSGISSMACFMGYLCNYYVPKNKFSMNMPEGQLGLAELKRDLKKFNPTIIVLIHPDCLKYAGVGDFSIDKFRGSVFVGAEHTYFEGYRCIATYHPSQLKYDYTKLYKLRFDLIRAKEVGSLPEIPYVSRHMEVDLQFHQVLQRIEAIQSNSIISLDIEGTVDGGITCLSIATSKTHAFIVPFDLFDIPQTADLIVALRHKLSDHTIGVVLQNAMYDWFALAYCFAILIRNIHWDTMLSGWELYPEFPKGLDFMASIYTYEPYYKHERTINDRITHYTYCCKDSCVTFEIYERHRDLMNSAQHAHFIVNLKLLYVLCYMQLRGINYDVDAAKQKLEIINHKIYELQLRINTRAGRNININSPLQLKNFLYYDLALPKQHPPKKDGPGIDKSKLSTDINALLKLLLLNIHPVIAEIILFRNLTKLAQTLNMEYDDDNRMRASYNVVGTTTGRLSCQKSPTGRGGNLQTITKPLRDIYTADPNHYFFQVDLAGADGWTVAAHCAALGDRTMLDDYLAGIKPAQVIALMFLDGAEVSRLSRSELKLAVKKVKTPEYEWLYFTSKRVQHGTNYLLGIATMLDVIIKDSNKLLGHPIQITKATCKKLQDLYKLRYHGVKAWQSKTEFQIKQHGTLSSGSGHVRQFFGRRNDNKTLRDALAQEPQNNTTYVTNLAALNLWNDPGNRRSDNSLIIQPLHQVHDALLGQFPCDQEQWAISKLTSYFDIEIDIAGIPIKIPFEGEYGTDWKNRNKMI